MWCSGNHVEKMTIKVDLLIITIIHSNIVLQVLILFTGPSGVLVSSSVFKTARDLRARSAGFDSQAVPPKEYIFKRTVIVRFFDSFPFYYSDYLSVGQKTDYNKLNKRFCR
jgi:hypothetical protein